MVDTEEKLQVFLPVLRGAPWVAVDTEADSLHAYPEKVCLIQISTPAGDTLIDPLAGFGLQPLLEVFGQHELIMHGSDYDLRLLHKHHQFVPDSIFDTMLGARLVGLRQFGLSHLVEKYLGIKLEKGSQKANWARRPLTEKMECYARNDTHHLKAVADELRTALKAKGRLAWHQETCARLIQDSTQNHSPDPDAVWRIKGSHFLGRPALAVLRELWHWREEEALAANKPPFFVMSHEALVEIAKAAASGASIDSYIFPHISERRRTGLLKAVRQGLEVPAEAQPRVLRSVGRHPSESEQRRFTELQRIRDARAAELELDATLIASRSVLSDLAYDWERFAPSLMKWQRELLSAPGA